MTLIRKISVAAALVVVVGFTGDSLAGTATNNMSLSATIASNCTISAVAPAAFPYDAAVVNLTTNYTTSFNISYTCTSGAAPSITLDQGTHALGGSTPVAPARQMASGINRLIYNVFASVANQTTNSVGVAWGTNLAMGPTLAAGTGSVQTVPAYVAITAGQITLPAGTYTDTIVMTANF